MSDAQMDQRVTRLETTVAGMAASVEKLSKDIDRLAEVITSAQRTPWGNVFTAAGLAIVVIGAIGTAYVAPIIATQTATNQRVTTVEQDMGALWQDIVPEMRERIAVVEARLNWERNRQ